jgi:hypothetical protein
MTRQKPLAAFGETFAGTWDNTAMMRRGGRLRPPFHLTGCSVMTTAFAIRGLLQCNVAEI